MAHSSPDLAGDVDVITHAAVCICLYFVLFRFKNEKIKFMNFTMIEIQVIAMYQRFLCQA